MKEGKTPLMEDASIILSTNNKYDKIVLNFTYLKLSSTVDPQNSENLK